MSELGPVGDVILAFVGLYPIVTAAAWIAGGVLFRWLTEHHPARPDDAAELPGVTLLMPAHNEAAVIGDSVRAALRIDYPRLEVLVLDDGSTDGTADAAAAAAAGNPRVRVIPDGVNLGKANRLNRGVREAAHDLLIVADADTTVQPDAVRALVANISRSPRIAAVAGGPQVTNRGSVLAAMQVLELASIVGLIRRTQALAGRVGVVAGVVGIFRRSAVLEVGGYDGRMATEDIDLTYKLLLAGWETDFEPNAVAGMQVPTTLRALWMQRTRWARGQGEVLHVHGRDLLRWRNRRTWPIAGESILSMVWLVLATVGIVLTALDLFNTSVEISVFEHVLAWGIAIAVIATIQMGVAMALEVHYDRTALPTMLLGPLYPAGYWLLAGAAALRSELGALVSGPREERVVWDMPREKVAR